MFHLCPDGSNRTDEVAPRCLIGTLQLIEYRITTWELAPTGVGRGSVWLENIRAKVQYGYISGESLGGRHSFRVRSGFIWEDS